MNNAIPTTPIGNWDYVFSSVVTGLVVVFLILAILIFLIWLMGKLAGSTSEKTTEVPKPVLPRQTSATVTEQSKSIRTMPADDGAVIAAITAAIHTISQEEGKQYRITKIAKSDRHSRPIWGRVGVSESMSKIHR